MAARDLSVERAGRHSGDQAQHDGDVQIGVSVAADAGGGGGQVIHPTAAVRVVANERAARRVRVSRSISAIRFPGPLRSRWSRLLTCARDVFSCESPACDGQP